MPFVRLAAFAAVLAPLVSLACGQGTVPAAAPPPPAAGVASGGAGASVPPARDGAEQPSSVSGTVAEVTTAGGYTWARLSQAGTDTWIAAPEVLDVGIGDRLDATVSAAMPNFRSRTLDREFDMIYFVSRIARDGEVLAPARQDGTAAAAVHGSGGTGRPETHTAVEPVAPVPGGLRIAEIWSRRQSLGGRPVTVRGRVVKANYDIMGTNWYHLQDGSGAEQDGTHDLVITAEARARVGDVVTISGTLTTGKDFGAGYAYDVIVERASLRE